MFPFPHLGELGSAAMWVLLAIGAGGLLPTLIDTRSTLHRSLMLGVAAVLALRYIIWRGTDTLAPLAFDFDALASWLFYTIEAIAMVGSLSAYVLLSRVKIRSDEADANNGWWWPAEPKVAILIATYNEDKEILERTIVVTLC